MGDIKFDDGSQEFSAPPTQGAGTDLTGKLVSWGLAKDRQQAQTVMIIIAAIALLGAAYFMFFSGSSEVPSAPVYN